MSVKPQTSNRTMLALVVTGLSLVLSACSFAHDVSFLNSCERDVEIGLVDADLYSTRDKWTSLSMGEASPSFALAIPDGQTDERAGFELVVRARDGEPLSRTVIVFGEALLMEDSSDYFASWQVELAGEDCSPVLPAVSIDSGDPFTSTFLFLLEMGLTLGVMVGAVLIPVLLLKRRKRNRKQLEDERLQAEGEANLSDAERRAQVEALMKAEGLTWRQAWKRTQ